MAGRRIQDCDRAMHCLTKESFGPELAPKPYWYETPTTSPTGIMLAYTHLDLENLSKATEKHQNQNHRAMLNPHKLQARPVSISLEKGQQFGFSVRIVPVIRRQTEDGRHYDLDVAVAWKEDKQETRAEIYCRWMTTLMERQGGAEPFIDTMTLAEPLTVRRMRRNQKSGPVLVTDATVQGTLEVKDKELFRRLLSDGIGRQKSYGNGMVRLRAL